jgi:hypothetical protein
MTIARRARIHLTVTICHAPLCGTSRNKYAMSARAEKSQLSFSPRIRRDSAVWDCAAVMLPRALALNILVASFTSLRNLHAGLFR